MIHFLYILIFLSNILMATGAWMFTGRTHPELKWHTIETDHFDIHYHEEIRDIAVKGASISEQIRPALLKQMGLDNIRRLDIVFTSEDEVLNGFAMQSNHTVIWVDQNDAALWSGNEKWLRTVLAHELQHLVYFNTVRTWLPEPMNSIYAGVPSWVVEGLAEYYTEKWRPFRYDISHKGHVINNTVHKIPDPHNDGFSKSLYLADRFGDSTIIKILNHRDELRLLNFKDAFKKHTGIKLKRFNEDWRQHMNTFFYGQRAQKERLEDIGLISNLPLRKVTAFDYFPDTMRVAMIGLMSRGQRDLSLVVATRDTTNNKKTWKEKTNNFSEKLGMNSVRNYKWKFKEYDHGVFGELIQNLDVSPDGKSIVYPKYRFGTNQSLMFGIWHLDLESNKKRLLTPNIRANYPQFSPDGSKIVFTGHENSTTQLYTMNLDGSDLKLITDNSGDTQIITPVWSPDGKAIAYAQSDPDGHMDIHILELKSAKKKQITDSPEGDYFPIWHPDGQSISFTGLYDYTPNLYTHDLEIGGTIRNTDVGDAVMGKQWNHQINTITAMTLNTFGFSRVVDIDPSRIAKMTPIKMNSAYTSWRTKSPDYPLEKINYNSDVTIHQESSYKFYKHLSHVGSVVLPDIGGLFANSVFTDGMGRHLLGGVFFTDYDSLFATMIQYNNYTGFPFKGSWGLNFYKDLFFTFQFYNRDQYPFVEVFNGISIWWTFPYNFGNFRTANHSLGFSVDFMDRQSFDIADSLLDANGLQTPESGEEGKFSMLYTFKNQRNHRRNLFAPNQGYGLQLKYDFISPEIYGNLTYNRASLDAFHNQKIGPFSLYSRFRYQQISGGYLNQDQLGIFNIPNYYISGAFVPGREYMSPRGLSDVRFGEQAFMGTLEFRAPVAPFQILEMLKIIQIGNPTFAFISDIGNAWYGNSPEKEVIVTTGAEFRIALSLAKSPLFIFSYGWAQTMEKWGKDFDEVFSLEEGEVLTIGPKPYFQMTLINPF